MMCTVSEVPTTNIITGSRAVIKSMLMPLAPITPRPHKMAPSTTTSGSTTPHHVRNVNQSKPVTSSTDRLMNTASSHCSLSTNTDWATARPAKWESVSGKLSRARPPRKAVSSESPGGFFRSGVVWMTSVMARASGLNTLPTRPGVR